MKMKLTLCGKFLGAFLILAAATCVGAPAAATNDAPKDVVRISVFEDNATAGKDPFFPKSLRRAERVPTAAQPTVAPIAQLSLKGISGPSNRRFALINNQPLGVGEESFVRISSGQVKVRCWEIRENSVIISLEGDPEKRELRLREGL